jgi:hypothetical protein
MIIAYFKRLIIKNKAFILEEVLAVKGLMQLLMKQRNTDQKWTKEEKREIKNHLKSISKVIPALIIFLLPGGSLLLPFLAEVLDRRKTRRLQAQQERKYEKEASEVLNSVVENASIDNSHKNS